MASLEIANKQMQDQLEKDKAKQQKELEIASKSATI